MSNLLRVILMLCIVGCSYAPLQNRLRGSKSVPESHKNTPILYSDNYATPQYVKKLLQKLTSRPIRIDSTHLMRMVDQCDGTWLQYVTIDPMSRKYRAICGRR